MVFFVRDFSEGCVRVGEVVCFFFVYLADEGGIGEGWFDVGVFVEFMILG